MANFSCSLEELKRVAADFVKAAPDSSLEELDAGLKCFNLYWLGFKAEQAYEVVIANSVMSFVHNKYFEAERKLLCSSPQ